MMHYAKTFLILFAFTSPELLLAQQDIDNAAIERELDVTARLWQDAFNRHNAQAVAMTYAEQCDVVHNAQQLPNRAAIEQSTADYFRKNPQVQTRLTDIRRSILSPTAVVESGTWTEWNHSQPGLATRGSYTSALLKTDGQWQVIHERAAPYPSVFPAFFVNAAEGSWHEQSAQQAVDTYQWVLSQKFIQFTSRSEDAKAFGMIGAEPRSGELIWWVFHNDGSVEIRKPMLSSPSPNLHEMTISSDSHLTNIAMQIKFQNDDEVELTAEGQIHGVQFNGPMHWKREKQIADHGWLYSEPPAEIPTSMSQLDALRGSKWVTHEFDGASGTGGARASWILDGKFFLCSGSLSFSDNSSWSHVYIIGRDPDTQQMTKGWEFCSDGAVSEFTLASDGKSLAGKSFGGMFGNLNFSGEYQLDAGVLDYSARLNIVGESTAIPYRWIYRDALPVK